MDTCDHVWERVDKAEAPKGKDYLVCRRCPATRLVDKPVRRESKDEKPLLME